MKQRYIRLLDVDSEALLEMVMAACERVGSFQVLGWCQRRWFMDLVFERERDAVAAVDDMEHLNLKSSRQGRPIKILLKPANFDGGFSPPPPAPSFSTNPHQLAATAEAASSALAKAAAASALSRLSSARTSGPPPPLLPPPVGSGPQAPPGAAATMWPSTQRQQHQPLPSGSAGGMGLPRHWSPPMLMRPDAPVGAEAVVAAAAELAQEIAAASRSPDMFSSSSSSSTPVRTSAAARGGAMGPRTSVGGINSSAARHPRGGYLDLGRSGGGGGGGGGSCGSGMRPMGEGAGRNNAGPPLGMPGPYGGGWANGDGRAVGIDGPPRDERGWVGAEGGGATGGRRLRPPEDDGIDWRRPSMQ
ncbi:unnamed protein product, partial [Laminaria digitata]